MTRTCRNAIRVRVSRVGELLQPTSDGSEAGQKDDSVECIPDGKRMLRVLVVDDNQDAADSLAVLVNLWRHDVRAAYDGATALDMATVRQPDVLLLDLSMPNMDGYEVAKRLRRQARFKCTLLIAITGWADSAHRRLCDEAGFSHYLTKPIELSSLETLLLRERDRLAALAQQAPELSETTSTAEELSGNNLQGV